VIKTSNPGYIKNARLKWVKYIPFNKLFFFNIFLKVSDKIYWPVGTTLGQQIIPMIDKNHE
jgi:hypothetical protein